MAAPGTYQESSGPVAQIIVLIGVWRLGRSWMRLSRIWPLPSHRWGTKMSHRMGGRSRRTAGMRTFPLITVLGTVAAILARQFGGWIVLGGLLGVIALVTLAHLMRLRQTEPDIGSTTNAAMLLICGVGALVTVENAMAVAIAVGGGVAVLLQLKPELHLVARRLGDRDLKVIMQFVLITCITAAGAAQSHLRAAGSTQSAEDLADGGADRGDESGRIHRVQVSGAQRGDHVGWPVGRHHFQYGHDRQLLPAGSGQWARCADVGDRDHDCLGHRLPSRADRDRGRLARVPPGHSRARRAADGPDGCAGTVAVVLRQTGINRDARAAEPDPTQVGRCCVRSPCCLGFRCWGAP
jgi:hypothetical protein